MKNILLSLLFLTMAIHGYSEPIHFIKFIYQGDETKPIGTVEISVEKVIKPMDHPGDLYSGRGRKTDIYTFVCIRNYIKTSKFVSVQLNIHSAYYYKIVDSDGLVYYTYDHNVYKFFEGLKALIIEKNLDKNVLTAFPGLATN
jgi:hypothetical protein